VIAPATYLVFRITFDGGPVHLQIAAALEEVWGTLIPTIGLKLAKAPDFECYDGANPVSEAGSTMDYYVPVAARHG
jgi:AraC family transcriptional regulator